MCPNRIEVLQGIEEEALRFCPHCGLSVKRVISRATFDIARTSDPDKAAAKGFTTFRRAEKGVWERVAGAGPETIAGTKADIEAVEAEKRPKKVIDLDQPM